MKLLRIDAEPSRLEKVSLPMFLFLITACAYMYGSYTRHQENPDDRLMPSVSEMIDGINRTAFQPDRNGEYRLFEDTIASGRRFFISWAILFLAIILGLQMGTFPYFEHIFLKYFIFFDKVPALAVLPILFIVFGLAELSKISLIVIGVFPTIVLDTFLKVKEVPRNQLIKGMTLAASDFEVAYRIVLPQIFPKVLDTMRLNFKAMVLFLIAGEALAASSGLGYRIFVVRRYVAMDIIIPYVLWISLLLFLLDLCVRIWIKKRYPWLDKD